MGPHDILMTGGTRLEFENNALLGARNSVMALKKNAANDSAELFATYDKAHLLPFGEYLPFRNILEPLGLARLVPGEIDFWPGPKPETITIASDHPEFGGVKIGIQICYELVFSGRIIDRDNRPDFIFSPSNDAWFGPWGPPQHEAQGRLRAIEEGLPVIRVTPTGVSSVIYSDGFIADQIQAGVAGRIDTQIPEAGAPTFFSKHGNAIPLTLAALILLIISAIAILRARRYRNI
jgi:apolipoprotein N-acyltransferase